MVYWDKNIFFILWYIFLVYCSSHCIQVNYCLDLYLFVNFFLQEKAQALLKKIIQQENEKLQEVTQNLNHFFLWQYFKKKSYYKINQHYPSQVNIKYLHWRFSCNVITCQSDYFKILFRNLYIKKNIREMNKIMNPLSQLFCIQINIFALIKNVFFSIRFCFSPVKTFL